MTVLIKRADGSVVKLHEIEVLTVLDKYNQPVISARALSDGHIWYENAANNPIGTAKIAKAFNL